MRTLSSLRQPLFLTLCAALSVACGETVDTPPTGTDDSSGTSGSSSTVTGSSSTTSSSGSSSTTTSGSSASSNPTGSSTSSTSTNSGASGTSTGSSSTSGGSGSGGSGSDSTSGGSGSSSSSGGDSSSGSSDSTSAEPLTAITLEELREFFNRDSTTTASCFHCHAEGGDLPQVFKNDDTLYDTLLTKTIMRCNNKVLVKPGEPENSVLYLVLAGEPCGEVSRMPSGCSPNEDPVYNTCTSAEELERIRLWIVEGAPEN